MEKMRENNLDKLNEDYLDKTYPILNKKMKFDKEKFNKIKPKRLYKYMSLSESKNEKLNSLKDGFIWMTNSNELNDPFECVIKIPKSIRYNFYSAEYNEYLKEKKRAEKILEDIKKLTYITSLSETNNSILMWSHYADSHKGICIEYDFDELYKCQNENLKLVPVIYKNEFVEMVDFTNWHNNFLHAFARKGIDWNYEKEWRFIRANNCEYTKGFREKSIKPKCIYLGLNIDESLEMEVKEFFYDIEDIKIKKMVNLDYKYEVNSIEHYQEEYENLANVIIESLE